MQEIFLKVKTTSDNNHNKTLKSRPWEGGGKSFFNHWFSKASFSLEGN